MPNEQVFDKNAHDTLLARRADAENRGKNNSDREKTDNRSLDLRLRVVEERMGLRS